MEKRLIFMLMLICGTLCSSAQGMKSRYTRAMLEEYLVRPGEFKPLPQANSTYWREKIPPLMRMSYIRVGEEYLGKPWAELSLPLFAEFKTNGNRTRYETVCFEKRRQLGCLAMAEIMEGNGRFIDDIIHGLQSMIDEIWWGLPAHYGTAAPLREDQNVDLFNAETANLMVWVAYMLREEIEARSPQLCQQIRDEIERRILQPALTTNYWWKRAGMNWNPWICSNWLACVLFCETDRKLQLDAVQQIIESLDRFMDAYPQDGGCDEGAAYWNRAAASLFDALYLLRLSTGGLVDMSEDPKLQGMGSFIYKTYIGDGQSINFADSHGNNTARQVDVIYPFGVYLNDVVMCRFARALWAGDDRAGEEYKTRDNFTTLGREMVFLSHFERFQHETAADPALPNVWLPDLQIMVARDRHLFLAMKGGHNDESHNHNDVGSFIVYGDLHPLLIDPGVGAYTAQTFGNNRYDIWTMQSEYHNLPQINGINQHEGKDFRAHSVKYSPGVLSVDIAATYPAEAAVGKWVRQVRLVSDHFIEVTEDYELKECTRPAKLMFVTTTLPLISKNRIEIGDYMICFKHSQLKASYEDISNLLDDTLRETWGDKMYRIILTVQSNRTKGKVSYRIRRKKH